MSSTRLWYAFGKYNPTGDQTDLTQVHVDKVRENSQNFETSHAAAKLMHRFTEKQLEKLMDDEIMKEPDSYGH